MKRDGVGWIFCSFPVGDLLGAPLPLLSVQLVRVGWSSGRGSGAARWSLLGFRG